MLIQESLPHLRSGAVADRAHGASVVALSSITGVHSEPGLAAYGASKAALLSLIEMLNLEEAEHSVRGLAIAPGYVDTDMSAWTTDTIPAATMIPVADVAAVVDMALQLSRNTTIARVVMARSTSDGRRA